MPWGEYHPLLFCVNRGQSLGAHRPAFLADVLALLWLGSGISSPERCPFPAPPPLGSHHAFAHEITPFSSAIPGISAVFWVLLIGSLAFRLWVV